MTEQPLVSICIPAFNAGNYIEETLNCLLQQTYQNLEIIIVDDHSTDHTKKLLSKITDARVKIYTNPKKFAAAARNYAYKNSTGDYIVFFDADDWVENDFIESQLQCIRSARDVVVSNWGRFYHNDLNTITIDHGQIKDDLSFKEWIINYWTNVSHMTCPGRVLIPRNLVEKSGLWDEALSLNDDFPFFTRIFANCDLIRYNKDGLFYYRSGINGLSTLKTDAGYNSFYYATSLAISVAETSFPSDKKIKIACANILQNFIYDSYPKQPELLEKAKQKIKALGGSDFGFPAGGKTKVLASIFGWKAVKKMKNYLA